MRQDNRFFFFSKPSNLTILNQVSRRAKSVISPQFVAFVSSLTPLAPQSRFGDKTLKFQGVCPQNGTAVLKGLRSRNNLEIPGTRIRSGRGRRNNPLCSSVLVLTWQAARSTARCTARGITLADYCCCPMAHQFLMTDYVRMLGMF